VEKFIVELYNVFGTVGFKSKDIIDKVSAKEIENLPDIFKKKKASYYTKKLSELTGRSFGKKKLVLQRVSKIPAIFRVAPERHNFGPCISVKQKQEIYEKVNEMINSFATDNKVKAKLFKDFWNSFNGHFGIRKYSLLPKDQMKEGRDFIKTKKEQYAQGFPFEQ